MFGLKDLLDKYFGKNSRTLLWLIVFVAVVYLIARNINTVGNVLLVLLGFGAVVLVHEFGHFIAAKLSGIKVEAFSVGFPPMVAGIRRVREGYRIRILPTFFQKEDDESDEGSLCYTVGKPGKENETEYRVGLIPFGGFVKMLGQDDTGPAKGGDDPRSYANKPASIRAAVLASGVLCNVFSAVIIFMIVFLVGINLKPAVVGGVVPDSPAARAGLKAGDEIIEIAGKSDNIDFMNIGIAAALSGRDEAVALRVRHEDGSEEDLALVAEEMETPTGEMRLFGIVLPQSLTVAELSKDDANDLHMKTGLLPGDRIKSVDGIDIQSYWELAEIVQNALVPEVTLSAERTRDSGEVESIKSQIPLNLSPVKNYDIETESDLGHIYSMVPRLWITAVSGEQVSTVGDTRPSLQRGDIILAAGYVENPTFKELRDVTAEHEDKELPIKVLRVDANGVEETLTIIVKPKRPRGSDRALIGIVPVLDTEHPVVAKTIATEGGPEKLDLQSGAVITAVDGAPVSNFYDIIREIKKYSGERITIDYRLNEEIAGDVVLTVDTGEEFITVKSDFAEPIPFEGLKRLYKASGPIDAVVMGYRKTVMFVAQTYVTLRRLVSGLVSPKNLMGPVGIISSSYRIVAEQPLIYYVYFLGLISAAIAVFNFLPLPPLDGGLVVLLLVEKIKGSALSERVQAVIAYAGWALILTLILYVTFNDIVRILFGYRL